MNVSKCWNNNALQQCLNHVGNTYNNSCSVRRQLHYINVEDDIFIISVTQWEDIYFVLSLVIKLNSYLIATMAKALP